MFSSPGRTPTARRRHDVLVSSRASTPGAGGIRTGAQTSRAGKARQSYRPSYGGAVGTAASETSSVTGARRKDRRRSLQANDHSLEPGTVLSRDDNHSVSVLSKLPVEVASVLHDVSPYDAMRSALDVDVGFAYLVLHGRCFVWSFLTRGTDSPTCFAYDLAALFTSQRQTSSSSSSSAETLVHCAFVTKGSDREPGLLLVSHDGTIRYGESVSNVLAFDRSQSGRPIDLGLGFGESVTHLRRCSNNVFVVATSFARLIGIRLISSGGHLQPVVAVFAQPRGIFGRFFGAAASIAAGADGLASLVSASNRTGDAAFTDLYAVSRQGVQKWSVSEGRGERVVYETEITQLIRLRDDRIGEGSHASESLRLLDAALTSSGLLILLYSFAFADGGVQHFGLASFEDETSGSSARLVSVAHLTYSCAIDSRPYSQPKLSVPQGGSVAYVIFSEAVIFRIVNDDGGLEESIELRDVASNRFIGFGTGFSLKSAAADVARMPLITQRSGLLLVEVDIEAASQISQLIASGEDRAVVDTHRLKSKLERGVFHADNVLNPISFDLPLDIRGDLMAAAEQLSDDIVSSESPSLIDTLDTRIQLNNRLERLRALASYLSLNGLLGTMTQNSLRRLCADAQLVAAGCDLWDYVNELLGDANRVERTGNILENIVDKVMEGEDGSSGDVLRDFFRDHLQQLNEVLQGVQTTGNTAASDGIVERSAVVTEVNRVLLTVFQAAQRYRSESAELYRLDADKIGYESWICSASNVEILQTATTATATLIRERTRQLGAFIDKEVRGALTDDDDTTAEHDRHSQLMLKGQLCELTGHLLNVYEERLSYLSQAGTTNNAVQREYATLDARFSSVERRAALLSLVQIGRTDRALYLAEQHRDFASLTELCSGSASSSEQRPHRLRHYLNKYGEPFAVALYTFYVQTGQMHTLLTQDAAFYNLLQRFLNSDASLNRVAWLHDLAVGDERQAGYSLLVEAEGERASTSAKRLMLSVAKLCHVSQLDEVQIATQSEQGAIEAIDDQLDLINVHDRIRTTLHGNIEEDGEVASAMDEDEGASTNGMLHAQEMVNTLGQNKPSFASLYVALARQLLARRLLLSDDLIDLLTLHDADQNSHADFALALEVFVRARDMPVARAQSILASLWRRAILFDDWNVLTNTKGMADEGVNARLRETALYNLLISASGNEATSEAVLDVEQMTLPTSADALEARLSIVRSNTSSNSEFAEVPQTSDVLRESEEELTALQTLRREKEIDRWYAEIRRLVEDDLGQDDDDANEITMDASREIQMAGIQSIDDEGNSDVLM